MWGSWLIFSKDYADLISFIDDKEDGLSAETPIIDCGLLKPATGLLKTSSHGRRRLLNSAELKKLE